MGSLRFLWQRALWQGWLLVPICYLEDNKIKLKKFIKYKLIQGEFVPCCALPLESSRCVIINKLFIIKIGKL